MQKQLTIKGSPCKKCGSTTRDNQPNKACTNCRLIRNREWKKRNREKVLLVREGYKKRAVEIGKKYYEDNKHTIKQKQADYRASNKERLLEYGREYSKIHKERKKNYRKANPHIQRNIDARRHAAKMKRFPAWADKDKITEIYSKCPKGMTVDHIFPLQGKLVSGLHVPENLQYLSKKENSSKGNRFKPIFIINEI
jgi:hypothetical protein